MLEIFDILVNYKEDLCDFYEWDKEDEIKHIKKINAYKVEKKVLIDLMDNDVLVNEKFLKEIENKTELYTNKYNKLINYACILFCKYEAISFLFDETGKVIARSKLLYDECDDVINLGKNIKEYKIDYKIINKLDKTDGFTKKEIKLIKILSGYIQKLYDNKKIDELNYLYYDCFGIEPNNFKDYLKIKREVLNGNDDVVNKLVEIRKVLNN